MKAVLRKNEQNIIIIDLKGEVDFASAEAWQELCEKNLSQKNIVFNLKELNFVGSDGIDSFLNTIKDLKKQSSLQFCCVGVEFQRVFAESEIKDIVIYEDEESAVDDFQKTMK